MFQIQASAFIDFWMKSMRIHNPVAREEDLLVAFKQSIVQKEQQLSLKRGHKAIEEAAPTQSTTPEETPPPTKRRIIESRDSRDLLDPMDESLIMTHIYAPSNTPDEHIMTEETESLGSSGPPTIAISGVDQEGVSPGATVNPLFEERDQFVEGDGTINWNSFIYLEDSAMGRYLMDEDSCTATS
jgi:hypothetical protein